MGSDVDGLEAGITLVDISATVPEPVVYDSASKGANSKASVAWSSMQPPALRAANLLLSRA